MAADAMSGGLKRAFSGEGHRQLGAGGSRKKSRRRELHPRPIFRKCLRRIVPASNTPAPCLHTACTDLALRELVSCWHRLTPDVRETIVRIARGQGDFSRVGE